jgi:hypothetical protein
MFYFLKPLPESTRDTTGYVPFIENDWLREKYMIFVYILQIILAAISIELGVWKFSIFLLSY